MTGESRIGLRAFWFTALFVSTVSFTAVTLSLPEERSLTVVPVVKYEQQNTDASSSTAEANDAPRQESETSAGLFSCYKGTDTMDATCFEQLLLSDIRTKGVGVAMSGFNEHLELYPQSAPWCHSAAHAAGDLSFSLASGEGLARLLSYGGTSCIMGYVHGVLEGFASSVEKPEDVTKAIKACSEAFGEAPETGTCYDGVGHAAWLSSRDLKTSLKICSAMPSDSHRQTCEMGVMMQIFEPAHDTPSMDMGPDRSKPAELCKQWPSGLSSEGGNLRSGCWRGVSYLLGKGLTDRWFSSDKSRVADNFEKWRSAVLESFKPCEILGKEGAEVCYQEAGSYLIGDWQEHDLNLAVRFCEALPSAQAACSKQAAAVASNYGWS